MKDRIKRWISCHVKNEHICYLYAGPEDQENFEKWKAECERQLKVVGYVDCFCKYCGCHIVRIIPSEDGKL